MQHRVIHYIGSISVLECFWLLQAQSTGSAYQAEMDGPPVRKILLLGNIRSSMPECSAAEGSRGLRRALPTETVGSWEGE